MTSILRWRNIDKDVYIGKVAEYRLIISWTIRERIQTKTNEGEINYTEWVLTGEVNCEPIQRQSTIGQINVNR